IDGVIDGSRGFIGMPHASQFQTQSDYAATLAHELIHWTKTQGRSERPDAGVSGFQQMLGIFPSDYPREEMTAEIGAAILLDYVGVSQDLTERADYIANWGHALNDAAEREAALGWAVERAQLAVDYLLGLADGSA
ncbi:MAG: zincin-like metallopeptidase domain-containing protein, partial [Pollutimonas bauzanensis]